MEDRIRVLVVDDHAIIRDGIRSLLSRQARIEVVGEAGDGETALEKVAQEKPDVVLMDITMPGMDGLEATRRIREAHPETRILILTQHDNKEYVLSAIEAGAAGYVPKKAGGAELVTAIRSVHEEGAFLHPSAARELVVGYTQRAAMGAEPSPLTPRETEVLTLIAEGKSSKEIADLLCISVKTVMVHRTNIMQKLDVHSAVELVRYAIREGLIDL